MLRIDEKPRSRSGTSDPPSQIREYIARGEFDENYVRAAAYAQTPAFIAVVEGVLYRQDISLSANGYCLFDITVPYDRRKRDVGSWTFSFDTTGGTSHIAASKETIRIYDSDSTDGTNPVWTSEHDYKQLIGYNGEDVAGTDIPIPAAKFTIEFKHPLGVVTPAYMKYVFDITGHVNSTTFMGFPAGEILFLGCRGSDGSEAEAVLSYDFAREKNVTALEIGRSPVLFTVAKKGWEYGWIRYKSDVSGDLPKKIPEAFIVERVFDTADLKGLLGFG